MDIFQKYKDAFVTGISSIFVSINNYTTNAYSELYSLTYTGINNTIISYKYFIKVNNSNYNPVIFVLSSNITLLALTGIYNITHGQVVTIIIEWLLNLMFSVLSIVSVQVSVVFIVLDIMYYIRTKNLLTEQIYKWYKIGNNEDNVFTISEINFTIIYYMILFVYPVIMIITNMKYITTLSGILSLFPFMYLSMKATDGETICCEYKHYLKKLEKPITITESFICNLLFICVSLFFIITI